MMHKPREHDEWKEPLRVFAKCMRPWIEDPKNKFCLGGECGIQARVWRFREDRFIDLP